MSYQLGAIRTAMNAEREPDSAKDFNALARNLRIRSTVNDGRVNHFDIYAIHEQQLLTLSISTAIQ